MKHFFLAVFAGLVTLGAAQKVETTISNASMAFLSRKAIRQEVKLTPAQDVAVLAEIKKMNETLKGILSKRPNSETEAKSMRARATAVQLGAVTKLNGILTPIQRTRLREIALQQVGPFAILSPEITKELGLTPSQVGKVKSAQQEMIKKVSALRTQRQDELKTIPQPTDRNDKKQVDAYMEKARALMAKHGPGDAKTLNGYKKAAEEKALSILTAPQKTKWKAMLGTPFKLPKKESSSKK